MIRAAARDTAIGYVGALTMQVLGFATKVLLARATPTAELGVLLTGQSLVGLVLILSQLSLPDAVARFVGLYAVHNVAQAKGSFVSALRLSALSCGLVTLGLVLGAEWIANAIYQQTALAGVLVFLAVAMPFTTMADMVAAFYRGLGQLWVKVIYVGLARLLWVVVALVWLISQGTNTLLAVSGSYLLAAILSMLLTVGLFRCSAKWRLPALHAPTNELLGYSLPLLVASLLGGPLVNSGLPLLLGSLASTQALACYGLSLSLQLFIYLPVSALEQAALPVWSGQS